MSKVYKGKLTWKPSMQIKQFVFETKVALIELATQMQL